VQAAIQPKNMPIAGSPETTAKPSLLELRALTKTYGQVTALAGLEASVAPGEFVTVVGPAAAARARSLISSQVWRSRTAGGILRLRRQQLPCRRPARSRLLHAAAGPALALAQCSGQRHPRARGRGRAARGGPRQGTQDAAGVRPRRLRETVSASIVGRHASARGADAHPSCSSAT